MADGVAFTEHRQEQIPSALLEQCRRQLALVFGAAQQPAEQVALLFATAQRPFAMGVIVGRELAHRIRIDPKHRMQSETGLDLPGRARRPGMEAEMPVVTAPLDELQAVEWGVGARMGSVEYGNAAAGIAQGAPEGILVPARRLRELPHV